MIANTEWKNPNDIIYALRCTELKYASDFVLKGSIKFNTPSSWVKYAKENSEGRGDILEGIVAFCHCSDIEHLISLNKSYPKCNGIFSETINDVTYFRRKRTMELPCFCFYILKQNAFECPINTGIQTLEMKIPPSYFIDFANNISPEEAKLLPDEEKPATIYINNYKEFETRLLNSLMEKGLTREEIIIGEIAYYDSKKDGPNGWQKVNSEPPQELLLKDIKFSHQSEARFIINTDKQDIKNCLAEKALEIGSLADIAEYKEGYLFDGVRAELTGNFDL